MFPKMLVIGVLLIYATGFVCWYPPSISNVDEAQYIGQSWLLIEGRSTVERVDPFTGETHQTRPASYPIGTAVISAPFVALGGWRAAYVPACLSLLAMVWITARWVAADGRSPVFALLVMGFPSALAYARLATSDLPSGAVVALGLHLFWTGLDGRRWRSLLSGFLAGASSLFRETNVLPFVPLFAGSLLRRDRRWPALLLGGLLGAALRGAASTWSYGDPLFVRSTTTAYMFSLLNVPGNLPVDALGLLVFVPLGLVVAAAYRGRRRPEVLAAVALFTLLYLSYGYTAEASGSLQRVVLRLRFYIPLLPLLAFAYAEVLPRWWSSALSRSPVLSARFREFPSRLVVAWALALAGASLATHVVLHRYGVAQARVRDLIYTHTPDQAIVVTNLRMTQRYIQDYFGARRVVDREQRSPKDMSDLARLHDKVYVVLFDRDISDYLRQHSRQNAQFVEAIVPPPELVLDQATSSTERLRIWKLHRGSVLGPS